MILRLDPLGRSFPAPSVPGAGRQYSCVPGRMNACMSASKRASLDCVQIMNHGQYTCRLTRGLLPAPGIITVACGKVLLCGVVRAGGASLSPSLCVLVDCGGGNRGEQKYVPFRDVESSPGIAPHT